MLTGGAIEDAGARGARSPRSCAKLRSGDAGGAVRAAAARRTTGAIALAFDNRGGGRRLTEHLIGLGHRRLGYIAGPEERTTTRHRLEGHRAALAATGIAGGSAVDGVGSLRPDLGVRGDAGAAAPGSALTAVVAANDSVALGACAALRESGLRIPQDVSVAGFDDLPFSIDAVPALTTVRLPLAEAGARAGRIAMGRRSRRPGTSRRFGES